MGQQSNSGAPSGLEGVGQQAISVVLRQSVLDPTALVQGTGKPLPANGKWSVGKEAPPACPQTTDACVRILYRVPEDKVLCEWVVQLFGDGSNGVILEQNEDAVQYLLRRLSTSQAGELVLTRKPAVYPPIATAAHVQGPVVLRLFVSRAGTLEKAFVVSGPAMLQGSAVDAVKGWTFKPLMAGSQAVRFETDVTFDFKTSGPSSSRVTSNP
jgi:TonB family protein